jgi:hypothetical protein
MLDVQNEHMQATCVKRPPAPKRWILVILLLALAACFETEPVRGQSTPPKTVPPTDPPTNAVQTESAYDPGTDELKILYRLRRDPHTGTVSIASAAPSPKTIIIKWDPHYGPPPSNSILLQITFTLNLNKSQTPASYTTTTPVAPQNAQWSVDVTDVVNRLIADINATLAPNYDPGSANLPVGGTATLKVIPLMKSRGKTAKDDKCCKCHKHHKCHPHEKCGEQEKCCGHDKGCEEGKCCDRDECCEHDKGCDHDDCCDDEKCCKHRECHRHEKCGEQEKCCGHDKGCDEGKCCDRDACCEHDKGCDHDDCSDGEKHCKHDRCCPDHKPTRVKGDKPTAVADEKSTGAAVAPPKADKSTGAAAAQPRADKSEGAACAPPKADKSQGAAGDKPKAGGGPKHKKENKCGKDSECIKESKCVACCKHTKHAKPALEKGPLSDVSDSIKVTPTLTLGDPTP